MAGNSFPDGFWWMETGFWGWAAILTRPGPGPIAGKYGARGQDHHAGPG